MEKQELTAANLDAQADLIIQLERARIISGRTIDQVAELLGIESELAQSILKGERDLTLHELRLLAFAADAVIEYEVEAASEKDKT